MLKQISLDEAIDRYKAGIDTKCLCPDTEGGEWSDMYPTTLKDILHDIVFLADVEEEPVPVPAPEPEPEDDDEMPEELKLKMPIKTKEARKPGTPVKLDEGRIIALRTANPPRSYKWIAEDMGVSEATIFNRCKKLAEEGRL